MKFKAIAATAALLTLPAIGHAGDIAGFTTSGYVDFSVQMNDWDDSPAAPIPALAPGPLGFTNIGTDGDFSLNQVALNFANTPDSGFGAVIGVVLGDSALAIAPNNSVTANAVGFPLAEIALTEAYVQYVHGAFTVTGGKFFTLAGLEVFNSTANAQATRGLLFNLQPLSLTGMRVSYKLGDQFTVTAGMVNEVAGDTSEPGEDQKALELHLAYAPAENISLALTHYKTSEEQALAEGNPTGLTDLVASFGLGSVNLALNVDLVDFGDANNTKTTGIALYAGYAFSPMFTLSGRYETVTTSADATPDADSSSITLTGGFALAKNFDLLAEVRSDKIDGSTAFDGEDSGNTVAVKGIYKF